MKQLLFFTFIFTFSNHYAMDELSLLQKKNEELENKIIMFNKTITLNNQQYKEQLNFMQTEGSKLLNILIQKLHKQKEKQQKKYQKIYQEIQVLRVNNTILESIESKINGLHDLFLQYDTKMDRCFNKIDFLQKQIGNHKKDIDNIQENFNKKITTIYDMIMRLCSRDIIKENAKIQQEIINNKDNDNKIKEILEAYSIKLLNYIFDNKTFIVVKSTQNNF